MYCGIIMSIVPQTFSKCTIMNSQGYTPGVCNNSMLGAIQKDVTGQREGGCQPNGEQRNQSYNFIMFLRLTAFPDPD